MFPKWSQGMHLETDLLKKKPHKKHTHSSNVFKYLFSHCLFFGGNIRRSVSMSLSVTHTLWKYLHHSVPQVRKVIKSSYFQQFLLRKVGMGLQG